MKYNMRGDIMKDSDENHKENYDEIKKVLKEVIDNLDELGYNAITQVAGYLQSGDLGYISNYKDSRNKLSEFDRNDILEALIKNVL